jgi:hypothetical protein
MVGSIGGIYAACSFRGTAHHVARFPQVHGGNLLVGQPRGRGDACLGPPPPKPTFPRPSSTRHTARRNRCRAGYRGQARAIEQAPILRALLGQSFAESSDQEPAADVHGRQCREHEDKSAFVHASAFGCSAGCQQRDQTPRFLLTWVDGDGFRLVFTTGARLKYAAASGRTGRGILFSLHTQR